MVKKEEFYMRYNLIKLSDVYDSEKDNTPLDTIISYMNGFRKLDDGDVMQCIVLGSGECQLGWNSYCFFTLNYNCFEIFDGESLSYGAFNLKSKITPHIVTRAVSGCTVIVIKYGKKICFMHLDDTPATEENDSLKILTKFLDELNPHTDKFFIISSYADEECIGKKLTDKICAKLRSDDKFGGDEFNILNISRCEIKEKSDQNTEENSSCHVEFGIVMNTSAEPIVHADFYDINTGHANGYLEWKFNTTDIEGTILGYRVKNLDEGYCLGDGCCIIS